MTRAGARGGWLWPVIWSLCGLLALAACAAYFMRDNLFKAIIKPTVPFQVDVQPPAPDYGDAAAWAMRPQGSARRDAAARAAVAASAGDVFFVHPTTAHTGGEGWNADLADPDARRRLEAVALPVHAMAFADAGDLWAPRYRQAVLFALLTQREDSREAIAFAHGDVIAAFQAFQAARDPARPYVLVGVGQGGLHVQRLLQEVVAAAPPDAPARAGLAAAYVIDQPMPLELFQTGGALAGLGLCARPGQTGCVVTFMTEDAGDARGRELVTRRALHWTARTGYVALGDRTAACVNPLNGGAGPFAPPSANDGSVAANGLRRDEEPPLLPGETGARCEDGGLQVEVNRPAALTRPRFELASRSRLQGFNLFYAPLGRDAATRMAAHKRAMAGR
jgi:hypothetical protein